MALAPGPAKARIFVVAPGAERPVARRDLQFRADPRQRESNNRLSPGRHHRPDVSNGRASCRLDPLECRRDRCCDRCLGRLALRYTTPKSVKPDLESLDGLREPAGKEPEGSWTGSVGDRSSARAPASERSRGGGRLHRTEFPRCDVGAVDPSRRDARGRFRWTDAWSGICWPRCWRRGRVERLQVGDAVVGLSGGAFSTHVVVDANHVAAVPQQLPIESAATIPVAFLTAYYGLSRAPICNGASGF